MRKDDAAEKAISTNRKAFSNYEIIERVEAGISLLGTEVKSIREGGFSFRDGYVEFRNGEMWLVGIRVAPYTHGNSLNHPDERDRKLLLHKREIAKIGGRATERGLTIVPLRAYFKAGRIKIEIGSAVAAAGLGLLLGLERERSQRGESLFAGIRTFPLLSLCGWIGGWTGTHGSPLVLPLVLLAVTALAVASYLKTAQGEHGITTEVSAVLAVLLGALVGLDQHLLA